MGLTLLGQLCKAIHDERVDRVSHLLETIYEASEGYLGTSPRPHFRGYVEEMVGDDLYELGIKTRNAELCILGSTKTASLKMMEMFEDSFFGSKYFHLAQMYELDPLEILLAAVISDNIRNCDQNAECYDFEATAKKYNLKIRAVYFKELQAIYDNKPTTLVEPGGCHSNANINIFKKLAVFLNRAVYVKSVMVYEHLFSWDADGFYEYALKENIPITVASTSSIRTLIDDGATYDKILSLPWRSATQIPLLLGDGDLIRMQEKVFREETKFVLPSVLPYETFKAYLFSQCVPKKFFAHLGEIDPDQEILDRMFVQARRNEGWMEALKEYLYSDGCFWYSRSTMCKFNRKHIPTLLKIKWHSGSIHTQIQLCMPSLWNSEADLMEYYLHSEHKEWFIGLAVHRPVVFDQVFKTYSTCEGKYYYDLRVLCRDEILSSDLKYLPQLGAFATFISRLVRHDFEEHVPAETLLPELLGFCGE
jgi:hypothetical protein